jgi:hypothetical protein
MSKSRVAIMNERRQKAANAYDRMDDVIKENTKVMHNANFENTTTKKIERRMQNVFPCAVY